MYYKHGKRKTAEYEAWHAMLQRCNNPQNRLYQWYGERGISVHPSWLDFSVFLSDVGVKPSPELSLDRIKNDGNYEPGNVRWATKKEQANNRRFPSAHPNQSNGGWVVRLQRKGIKYYGGWHKTKEEAEAALTLLLQELIQKGL